jgi:nicotinamidase/pyrazinamidase
MSCLICVDLQNDFLPGGVLSAPLGNEIIEPIARIVHQAREKKIPIVTSLDWHPATHCSFKSNGGIWPVHCVQDTHGAELSPGYPKDPSDIVIRKGTDPTFEAYSAFHATSLAQTLKEMGVTTVYICGLTTEYCVFDTAKDALKHGFHVNVLTDLIAEVDPSAKEQTLARMRELGIATLDSKDF